MNTIAIRKDAFGIARIVGKFYPTANRPERTVEITVKQDSDVVAEVRQLLHSARDLRRQVPAFDEQIKSRRARTKRLLNLADNVHSTIFAMGSATAVAGGAARVHAMLRMGAIAMGVGVAGAIVAGVVATLWDIHTQAIIKRRHTILQRASRYESMAQNMDPSHKPTGCISRARVEVSSGEPHRPAVVS